jgi:hypothetical protein
MEIKSPDVPDPGPNCEVQFDAVSGLAAPTNWKPPGHQNGLGSRVVAGMHLRSLCPYSQAARKWPSHIPTVGQLRPRVGVTKEPEYGIAWKPRARLHGVPLHHCRWRVVVEDKGFDVKT